ncbi:MAG: hypothetical protein JXP36_17480 [Bacteroidales bacterium]|nr:hypothetical protein [Bacteroidales bacterium]
MRYLFVLVLLLISIVSSGQISNAKVVRVANSTTTFSESLSEGNMLIDMDVDKSYLILKAVAGTNSISDLTLDVDYKEIANAGTGDDWGSDIVITDATLNGSGTSGSVLKVDTTIIATKADINDGTEDLNIHSLTLDSMVFSDTYWDDLQVNLSSVNLKSNYEPDWIEYKGGYILRFKDDDQDAVYFTAQLPHSYKHGSDIEFHIHLAFPNGNSGNMKWSFTYSWANIGSTFSNESQIEALIASSGVTDKHDIGDFGLIDGTGKKGSSVLLCSLERNAETDSDDTYESDVYMVALDFHFQIDKPGSNNMIPDE